MIACFPRLAMMATVLLGSMAAQTNTPQQTQIPPGISEGLLIYKVQPIYPQLARQARVQGTVVLQALIDKDGTLEQLDVLSGPPMLIKAAMDAVKQWRYKPYLVDGQPVTVQTTINVSFQLNDAAPGTHEPPGNSSTSGSNASNPPATAQAGQSAPSDEHAG